MAFTQGRSQPDVLRGPQWRPVPLAGITMAGAAIEGFRLTAVLAQVPVLGGVPGGWMSSGARPARTA